MFTVWEKLKKSMDFFLVFFVLLLVAALYKYNTRTPDVLEMPPPKIIKKNVSAQDPKNSTSDEKPSEANSSPVAMSAPPLPSSGKSILSTSVITMIEFDDPFCLFGKKDFVILPDFYLKMFYLNRDLKVILPSSFAECFKGGSSQKIIFYKFAPSFRIPLTPLASASTRVITATEHNNFEKAVESINSTNMGLRSTYAAARDFFINEKSRKFVVLNFNRISIDDYPKFWPDAPAFHPVANFLQKEQGNSILARPDLITIDSRSKKNAKLFPINQKTHRIVFTNRDSNSQSFNLTELLSTKKKYFVNAKRDRPILILGAHQHDWGPINVANYLMGYGFKNIFITDPVSYKNSLGNWNPPANSVKKITPEELKSLFQRKEKVALIDGRDQYNGVVIRDAFKVPLKVKDSSPSKKTVEYVYDMDAVSAYLKPIRSAIVVYGKSETDKNSIELAKKISNTAKSSVYWLAGGYRAWRYNIKYKWEDEKLPPKAKKKTRKTAIPARFKRGNPNAKGQFVPFDKGKYTGVVPGSKALTVKELKEIRKNKKKTLK